MVFGIEKWNRIRESRLVTKNSEGSKDIGMQSQQRSPPPDSLTLCQVNAFRE